jgi:WD40 repeat protein
MVEEDPTFGKRFIVPDTIESLKKYESHSDNVEDVCWLSDDHFVSCSLDKTIAVWNANETAKYAKPVEILEGHGEGVYCLKSDGKGSLISGAASAELFLWDMSGVPSEGQRQPKMKFSGHSSPIYSLAVSSDGKNIVSGNKSGTCLYHDVSRPEPISVMDHHKNVAQSVDFSPDGSLICSASNDGTIQIWDVRSSRKARCVSKIDDAAATGVVFCCQWRPMNENEILSSGDDYCVKRWDLRKMGSTGPITNFFGHTSNVRTLCMSPCGQLLVSAAEDGCIRLWVIDEMLYVIEEQDKVADQLEDLDKKREDLEKRLDSAGRAVHEPLKQCVNDMHSLYDRFEELKDMKDERDAMHCLQARLGFTGHALNVSGVAWREVNNEVRLTSSSWDQTVQLFKFEKPNVNDFVLWQGH